MTRFWHIPNAAIQRVDMNLNGVCKPSVKFEAKAVPIKDYTLSVEFDKDLVGQDVLDRLFGVGAELPYAGITITAPEPLADEWSELADQFAKVYRRELAAFDGFGSGWEPVGYLTDDFGLVR